MRGDEAAAMVEVTLGLYHLKTDCRTMWINPKGTSPSRKSKIPHVERLSRETSVRGCQEQLPFLCLMKNFGTGGFFFPTRTM